jgi:GTPase
MFEVKEKPKLVERALLVGVQRPEMITGEAADLLDELAELVETLEIPVIDRRVVNLRDPQSHFLIGTGKAAELVELVREQNLDVIVFDDELSPAQQRNWEQATGICVIDRQEVILDIFAQRAQTREAILQVGLARMEYSLPRLKRAWTHLSRQRGGGGTVVRGQGETQLESDRRLVQERISRIKKELVAVVRQRDTQRKRRLKHAIPSAAIVGYTNAGKSSLLNRLTGASVLAEDKLFATLDPTTRQLGLPAGQKLLLTDTVGFVRRLPHKLIDAFRATLEEAVVSDFLIHVLDLTNPEVERHHTTTLEVLSELGAETKNIITVFNKTDSCVDEGQMRTLRLLHPEACFVSARTGEGIDVLVARIEEMLADKLHTLQLLIPHSRYDLINKLHRIGCVQHQKTCDDGVFIEGHIPDSIFEELHAFVIRPESRAEILE